MVTGKHRLAMSKRETSPIIVLGISDYRETSLIVRGLTPAFGQIDFVVRGARSIKSKSFPVIDLFRIIQADFPERGDGLRSLYNVELLSNNDSIALSPNGYVAVCKCASFITRNSPANIAQPILFAAVKHCLNAVAGKKEIEFSWLTLLQLVYLYEQGLLPDMGTEADDTVSTYTQQLIGATTSPDMSFPVFDKNYWPVFSDWVTSLCNYHGLKLPH